VLYGFNVTLDLVFDAMHNIPLNVASHHLHYYFNEGILTKQAVDKEFKIIPWTAGKLIRKLHTMLKFSQNYCNSAAYASIVSFQF